MLTHQLPSFSPKNTDGGENGRGGRSRGHSQSPAPASLNADEGPDAAREHARLLPAPDVGPGVVTHPGASPLRSVCAALVPTPRECVLLALFLLHYAMVYLDETFCHTVPHFHKYVLAAEYLQALPIRLFPCSSLSFNLFFFFF